jgi:hypothetical protein
MAEQRANPKENLPIALPKGDYVVHRRSSSSSGAMEISLPYGGRYDIADEDFHRIPAEALAQKGGAFLFRRHEFSAGYGLLLATPLSVGHALHLRYGYRLSRSMWISAGLRAGLRDYTTESSGVDVDGEERMVDGVVGTAVSFDVGPVELRASAAAVGRYLENQHTRLDLSPSSPYNSTWSGRMFAVGPEATFSVIMPINQALQWHVGLLANLLFAPAEPEVEMRSSSLAELGLGWTYD